MQNKGAIRAFAIALTLVCIYQLSFTYVSSRVEEKAEEYAQGDIEKRRYYLDSISSEPVYNFLGIRRYTYRETKERELNLGLDLKGGMNVVLEVSVVDLIQSLSNNNQDTIFLQAIQRAQELQRDSDEDFVTLFGRAFEEIAPNARLASIFNTVDLRDRIDYNSTNEEVLEVLREETQSAIDNSFNIIRTRIDQFGVVQPNIQRLEASGRILVELPGADNPDRVRNLLQSTAKLEFWETYENSEIYPSMLEANRKLKEIQDAEKKLQDDDEEEAGEEESIEDMLMGDNQEGDDQESIGETQSETGDADDTLLAEEDDGGQSLIDQIEGDTVRGDTGGLNNQQLAQNYPLFSVLMPNTTRQGELLPGPVVGISHYRDTAEVNEYLRMPQIRSLFPRDVKFLWSGDPLRYDESESYYELVAIKMSGRGGQAPLTGDVITDATAEFGQNRATANVAMSMNAEGAKVWARLTRENIDRSIAVVLDNRVQSHPRVNQEIRGGRSTIEGDFTLTEARDLANILESGRLPAPARIIQEAVVGPSLGQEAIDSGLNSFIIALLVVFFYMIFYYSRAGWVADLALLANIFFIMGVLASLGAVLTLPGIAGIVLTVGISVDANVLIYDRIREELRAGKGVKLAVADGYKNAYSAIVDANVTTLLTATILFIFGTGPIKGFATTLLIGILTSLFAAIFITRLIFEQFLQRKWKLKFASRLTENAFTKVNFNFLGKRKVFYAISSILIIISIASLATRGLNQGVDFTGGRNYVIRFDQPVSTVEVQDLLEQEFGQTPQVIIFGQDNQVRITTQYKINENAREIEHEIEEKIYNGLKPIIGEEVSFDRFTDDYRQSSQKVGPTIADDIKRKAVLAIFLALFIMFIYLIIRFKNWQYGMGAVAALVHDSLIVLGIFSLFYGKMPFSLEVDQAFIAAILTVVGYSINDTVVVFDRIREFLGLYPKRKRFDITNLALNSTLSRTFSTSLSTFVVLLAIFIFGGEVIRGFTFALLIGVIVGTYSSLFIATPVSFDTIKKVGEVKEKKGVTPGGKKQAQPKGKKVAGSKAQGA